MSSPPYTLIYWPGLPGRAEHIRLLLEEAGAAYTDTAQQGDPDAATARVLSYCRGDEPTGGSNLPSFAPPILQHGAVVLGQTPNILQYLGARHGLAASDSGDPADPFRVHALALTALDGLSNEVHDVHHPIAVGLHYEEQKAEAARRAGDYVATRLPRFLGYFERVLRCEASGEGPWLLRGRFSYADLVLFQCLDGVKFMFPKAMARLEKEGEHKAVFALYEAIKERPNIKAYLASERRQKYGPGIYRYYEELDIES